MFAATPDHELLRDAARRFLDDRLPTTRVRALMETGEFDRGLWAETAAMGWQGMAIPEAYGGAGYTVRELGVVLEELGRALAPLPFFSSVVLAAGIIELGGTEAQRAAFLPSLADGSTIGTLAVVEVDGSWLPTTPAVTATPGAGGWVLTGEKRHVLDGHVADRFVVLAATAEGPDLFVVPATAEGITVESVVTLDLTRPQATVRFDGVAVDAEARLGQPGGGLEVLERAYDRAAALLAYEQVGGAARCLEMSVAYAKERYQFGRPIGSFQAVKHRCADMLVALEGARSAALYAGWAAAEDPDELRIAAPVAKAFCSEAFFRIAADTIQVHGGIGFTWEHDAHLYLKRAKTDELLLGDPARWRARLGDRLGL